MKYSFAVSYVASNLKTGSRSRGILFGNVDLSNNINDSDIRWTRGVLLITDKFVFKEHAEERCPFFSEII